MVIAAGDGNITRPQAAYRSGRMHGFTYLGLLFAIVLMGIVLSAAGLVWHTAVRRGNETELLFVGDQYLRAITSYHAIQINDQNEFPPSLDALLEDRRFPMPVRHLRKQYIDPITNRPGWGLVRSGETIIGIYSLSEEEPLKKSGFPPCCTDFETASHYSDWKFVFRNDVSPPAADKAIQSGTN
jgi:type II secretory pathway pseudopilin PulG